MTTTGRQRTSVAPGLFFGTNGSVTPRIVQNAVTIVTVEIIIRSYKTCIHRPCIPLLDLLTR